MKKRNSVKLWQIYRIKIPSILFLDAGTAMGSAFYVTMAVYSTQQDKPVSPKWKSNFYLTESIDFSVPSFRFESPRPHPDLQT